MLADRRRVARIIPTRVLRRLGRVYPNDSMVLSQMIQNEIDAYATQIWVVLEPQRILVIGNGEGMVPEMTDYTYNLLQMFVDEVNSGNASDIDWDILADIERDEPTALRCLVWMVECVGFSAKTRRRIEEQDLIGEYGIGTLAFLQIANEATWVSRASEALVRQYPLWIGKEEAKTRPSYRLKPPADDQIQQGKIGYELGLVEEPLLDPDGNPLSSGTRVEITGLRESLDRTFRPGLLTTHFSEEFGEYIGEGRFILTIVDRVSPEGRSTPGGRKIEVKQVSHTGSQLFHETFDVEVEGKFYPCEAELYYDATSKGLTSPRIRRNKVSRGELTALGEPFNTAPWNLVNGYVDFPNVADDDSLWNTDKNLPIASRARAAWERKLGDLAEVVKMRIADLESASRQQRLRSYNTRAAQATVDVLRSLPAFEGVLPGAGRQDTRGSRRTRSTPTDIVVIEVFNEHRQGVAGVVVEFGQRDKGIKALATATTGTGGTLSFGQRPFGRYYAKITLPESARLDEDYDNPAIFNLSDNMPGATVTFRLTTGDVKRPPRVLVSLEIAAIPFSDNPDALYALQRMHLGVLEINSSAPYVGDALSRQDEIAIARYYADIIGSAMAEWALPQESLSLVLRQKFLVSAGIFEKMAEQPSRRRRRGTIG